jgi:predicted NBD/HSP70 family sugar kinase
LYVGGPAAYGQHIQAQYAENGARAFDAGLMTRIYEQPFQVTACTADEAPAENEKDIASGGHMDGCRIGFDLGASDHKVAAVIDGEAVFSTETRWNPTTATDPDYHYHHIQNALREAASHMPRVDAIGGSSAGVYVDNRPMVASLYRSIPEELFENRIKPLFLRLREEWGVPLEVINDGDVTALAGALSLEKNAMLGIAMGSSEAVGYLNRAGHITGWLNELAFAPVDLNPNAAADEWSGDIGGGALYFSQQAVNRLAPAAGITFPDDMPLPDRLKQAQAQAEEGDENAARIFETIGVYLGYTIPYYARFYDYDNLLILGRVTSGRGGDIILSTARKVLSKVFPDTAAHAALHVPDEKSRRVGQAVAAASLPRIS